MSNIEKTNPYPSEQIADPFFQLSRKTRRGVSVPSPERTRRDFRRSKTDYLLFSPIHYEPGYAYPLLIWFHGPGADETELFRIMPLLSLRNYVAAAPRGLTPDESGRPAPIRQKSVEGQTRRFSPLYDWPETDRGIEEAENRFFETVEKSKLRCNIAPSRIFLAGIGTGGSMALRIGTRHPETVAGIVSFSGSFPTDHLPLKLWSQIRDLPIMMTVGAKNSVVSPETVSRQLRLFHTAGMSVSIRQYKTADETTPQMFQDANRWIMEQILG